MLSLHIYISEEMKALSDSDPAFMIIWYLYTSQFDQHVIGYDIFAESGGARTELERNRSALAIFTERERECAQFKKTRA
jgi:hypothetical protein